MSTRALIGYVDNGKIRAVYSHSDGYPEYTGKVLAKYYDATKTRALIECGGISMLGKDIGVKCNFGDRLEYDADNVAMQCRLYARDRGEDLRSSAYYDEQDFMRAGKSDGIDYLYLLKDDGWYIGVCSQYGNTFTKLDMDVATVS